MTPSLAARYTLLDSLSTQDAAVNTMGCIADEPSGTHATRRASSRWICVHVRVVHVRVVHVCVVHVCVHACVRPVWPRM